jgi:hypothetical protein
MMRSGDPTLSHLLLFPYTGFRATGNFPTLAGTPERPTWCAADVASTRELPFTRASGVH